MKRILVGLVLALFLVLSTELNAATSDGGFSAAIVKESGTQTLKLAEGSEFSIRLFNDFKIENLNLNFDVADIRSLTLSSVKQSDVKMLVVVAQTDGGHLFLGYLPYDTAWVVKKADQSVLKLALNKVQKIEFATAEEDVTDAKDYAKAYVQGTLEKGDWVEFKVVQGNKSWKERYIYNGIEDGKVLWTLRGPDEAGKQLVDSKKESFIANKGVSIKSVEETKLEKIWIDNTDESKDLNLLTATAVSSETKEEVVVHQGVLPWTYFKGLVQEKDKEENITRNVVAVSRLVTPKKEDEKVTPEEKVALTQKLQKQLAALLAALKDNPSINPASVSDMFDLTMLTLKLEGKIYQKHVPTLDELRKKIEDRVAEQVKRVPKKLEGLARKEKELASKQEELQPKIKVAETALPADELAQVKKEMELQRQLRDASNNELRDKLRNELITQGKINPNERMKNWSAAQKQYFDLNKEDRYLSSSKVEVNDERTRLVTLSKTPQDQIVAAKLERVKEVPEAKALKNEMANSIKDNAHNLRSIPAGLFEQANYTFPSKDYAIAQFPGTSSKVKFRKQPDGSWKIATLEI